MTHKANQINLNVLHVTHVKKTNHAGLIHLLNNYKVNLYLVGGRCSFSNLSVCNEGITDETAPTGGKPLKMLLLEILKSNNGPGEMSFTH